MTPAQNWRVEPSLLEIVGQTATVSVTLWDGDVVAIAWTVAVPVQAAFASWRIEALALGVVKNRLSTAAALAETEMLRLSREFG